MKVSVSCALMAALATVPLAFVQSTRAAAAQTPAGGPGFEVASMKVGSAGLGSTGTGYADQGGPGTSTPERWTCTSVPLDVLVLQGWSGFRVAGLPFGSGAPRYDIAARVPLGTSMDDFRLMIRRLLRERLSLVAHPEQREVSVTELAVAKGGIRMKDAEPEPPGAEPPPPRPFNFSNSFMYPVNTPGVTLDKDGVPQVPPGFPMAIQTTTKSGLIVIVGRMLTSAQIALAVRVPPYTQVVDKTGLTGKYDFILRFGQHTVRPAGAAAAPPSGAVPEASEPGLTIESALKDQLGLEFRQGKTMADFLVVDSFNRTPTEN